MNITLKTEYALRAIEEILVQGNDKPVSRKLIAKNRMVSEHFLEKIFINLQKKKIIRSIRGPGGGFVLARNIEDITLWDIYSAVDDPDNRIDDCYYKTTKDCKLKETCKTKYIWFKFSKLLKENMQSISLSDLTKGDINE